MMRGALATASVPVLALALMIAQAPQGAAQDVIRVTGERTGSLTHAGADRAAAELAQVPGGVSLRDADAMRRGASADMAEALATVPGLFIRSRFGGDEVRLSIRGSGISQTFGIRGVRLLRDGMPVTDAGGFTDPELVDFATAEYAEVYRGANALQYGAATLGGAINFVSRTCHSADPLRGRLELGSNTYLRPQLSGGTVLDNGLDVFFSLSGIAQNGFRDNAEQASLRSYANVGYRASQRAETRLHLTAQRTGLELPGPLTAFELRADPEQANGFWAANAAKRDIDRYRIALQQVLALANGRLQASVWYEERRLDHPLPFVVIDEDGRQRGASLRHEHDGRLAGRENRLIWGLLAQRQDDDGRQWAPIGGGERGALRNRNAAEADALELFLENRWQLHDRLQLSVGLQLAHARREARIEFLGAQSDVDERATYRGVNPRLGILWQPAPQLQLFANLGRSFEPPSLLQFRNEDDPRPDARATLREQTAVTAEIGGRGAHGAVSWELAAYSSWVSDEILEQETEPGSGQSFTTNADSTRHSGVELSLSGDWPLATGGHRLQLDASYTYSRLRFDGDARFGNNTLPGVPAHLGRLELSYRHPSGFHLGPLWEGAASSYVDFANSVDAAGYGIVGLRAGYEADARWRVFIDARNLADRAYASNTGITANARGEDGSFFNPGLTRALFLGVEASLR